MHNFNDTQVIIMAGGIGSRFWLMFKQKNNERNRISWW